MKTRGVRDQKIPKNANVICERPLMGVVDMFEPGFAVLSTLPKSCDLSEGMVDLSPA